MSRRRANGEGTVYPRKDGRWEGAAYVLTTLGTYKRLRVYGRTREEASAKLTDALAKSNRGEPIAANSQRLGEYLDYWLAHVVRDRVRPLTFRSYEMYVREHIQPGLGRKRLSQLTARDVRVFLDKLRSKSSRSPDRRGKAISSRTVFHIHAILRNALQDALREDLVTRNVARQVRISPGHRDEVEPLTVDEARLLLKAARGDRLFALYAVALSLGLRRGEALGLRWTDVDLDRQVLHVRQTVQRYGGKLHMAPPKTRGSRRSIPLLAFMVNTLRQHRERQEDESTRAGAAWNDTGLVFTTRVGTPIDPNMFSRSFAELCERAGIRHVRLHDLRHTCASMLLAQGVPPRVVMEILGHSSLDVTMRIYGHVMLDSQRKALEGMDGLLDDRE